MENINQVVIAIFASTGFWSVVQAVITSKQKRNEKADKMDGAIYEMLKGLGHDKITHLGTKYLDRNWLTLNEWDNLYNYLYIPYKKLGGNGSAECIVEECKKLERLTEKEALDRIREHDKTQGR